MNDDTSVRRATGPNSRRAAPGGVGASTVCTPVACPDAPPIEGSPNGEGGASDMGAVSSSVPEAVLVTIRERVPPTSERSSVAVGSHVGETGALCSDSSNPSPGISNAPAREQRFDRDRIGAIGRGESDR